MDGVEEKLPLGQRKGRGEMYKSNYQIPRRLSEGQCGKMFRRTVSLRQEGQAEPSAQTL